MPKRIVSLAKQRFGVNNSQIVDRDAKWDEVDREDFDLTIIKLNSFIAQPEVAKGLLNISGNLPVPVSANEWNTVLKELSSKIQSGSSSPEQIKKFFKRIVEIICNDTSISQASKIDILNALYDPLRLCAPGAVGQIENLYLSLNSKDLYGKLVAFAKSIPEIYAYKRKAGIHLRNGFLYEAAQILPIVGNIERDPYYRSGTLTTMMQQAVQNEYNIPKFIEYVLTELQSSFAMFKLELMDIAAAKKKYRPIFEMMSFLDISPDDFTNIFKFGLNGSYADWYELTSGVINYDITEYSYNSAKPKTIPKGHLYIKDTEEGYNLYVEFDGKKISIDVSKQDKQVYDALSAAMKDKLDLYAIIDKIVDYQINPNLINLDHDFIKFSVLQKLQKEQLLMSGNRDEWEPIEEVVTSSLHCIIYPMAGQLELYFVNPKTRRLIPYQSVINNPQYNPGLLKIISNLIYNYDSTIEVIKHPFLSQLLASELPAGSYLIELLIDEFAQANTSKRNNMIEVLSKSPFIIPSLLSSDRWLHLMLTLNTNEFKKMVDASWVKKVLVENNQTVLAQLEKVITNVNNESILDLVVEPDPNIVSDAINKHNVKIMLRYFANGGACTALNKLFIKYPNLLNILSGDEQGDALLQDFIDKTPKSQLYALFRAINAKKMYNSLSVKNSARKLWLDKIKEYISVEELALTIDNNLANYPQTIVDIKEKFNDMKYLAALSHWLLKKENAAFLDRMLADDQKLCIELQQKINTGLWNLRLRKAVLIFSAVVLAAGLIAAIYYLAPLVASLAVLSYMGPAVVGYAYFAATCVFGFPALGLITSLFKQNTLEDNPIGVLVALPLTSMFLGLVAAVSLALAWQAVYGFENAANFRLQNALYGWYAVPFWGVTLVSSFFGAMYSSLILVEDDSPQNAQQSIRMYQVRRDLKNLFGKFNKKLNTNHVSKTPNPLVSINRNLRKFGKSLKTAFTIKHKSKSQPKAAATSDVTLVSTAVQTDVQLEIPEIKTNRSNTPPIIEISVDFAAPTPAPLINSKTASPKSDDGSGVMPKTEQKAKIIKTQAAEPMIISKSKPVVIKTQPQPKAVPPQPSKTTGDKPQPGKLKIKWPPDKPT